MDTLTNLLKDSQIGIWCKRAAWIILVIGLFEAIASQFLFPGLWGYGWPLSLSQLLQALTLCLTRVPSLLFYFFMLYASGAVVGHFFDNGEEEEYEEEKVEDDEEGTNKSEDKTSD